MRADNEKLDQMVLLTVETTLPNNSVATSHSHNKTRHQNAEGVNTKTTDITLKNMSTKRKQQVHPSKNVAKRVAKASPLLREAETQAIKSSFTSKEKSAEHQYQKIVPSPWDMHPQYCKEVVP